MKRELELLKAIHGLRKQRRRWIPGLIDECERLVSQYLGATWDDVKTAEKAEAEAMGKPEPKTIKVIHYDGNVESWDRMKVLAAIEGANQTVSEEHSLMDSTAHLLISRIENLCAKRFQPIPASEIETMLASEIANAGYSQLLKLKSPASALPELIEDFEAAIRLIKFLASKARLSCRETWRVYSFLFYLHRILKLVKAPNADSYQETAENRGGKTGEA